ncbi:MAG: C39 family peptidase [Vulcanibacillus sp.]
MGYRTFSRDLGTPSFLQGSGDWSSEITSCEGTMASEGCFITSAAMIFKGFGDNVDPGTMLDNLKDNYDGADCPFLWSTAASAYAHTWNGKTFGTFDQVKDDIFDLIYNQGIPVMIHVPNHMIVAKKFYGTLAVDAEGNIFYTQITPSMIYINDPGSSFNETLQDVIDDNGSVDYITYYTA